MRVRMHPTLIIMSCVVHAIDSPHSRLVVVIMNGPRMIVNACCHCYQMSPWLQVHRGQLNVNSIYHWHLPHRWKRKRTSTIISSLPLPYLHPVNMVIWRRVRCYSPLIHTIIQQCNDEQVALDLFADDKFRRHFATYAAHLTSCSVGAIVTAALFIIVYRHCRARSNTHLYGVQRCVNDGSYSMYTNIHHTVHIPCAA